MHIFLDESGSFAHSDGKSSLSAVGALAIPHLKLNKLEARYQRIRINLPKENGKVKGRLLNEKQVHGIVNLLRKNEALFEVSLIDMGIHGREEVAYHKGGQAHAMTMHLSDEHHPELRAAFWDLRRRLERMSDSLYVQSVLTFDVIWRVVQHATLYFSQRRPEELGAFDWVIDRKGADAPTDWEEWWSFVVKPTLQSKSLRDPLPYFEGGDYSYFERFNAPVSEHLKEYFVGEEDKASDLGRILSEHFRFSSDPEAGLELVDILVNATRRALHGRLAEDGWKELSSLMVNRKHGCLKFVSLRDVEDGKRFPYESVARRFRRGGRQMLSPRMWNE